MMDGRAGRPGDEPADGTPGSSLRRRGRPRNPGFDQRIRESAASVYAEVGWSGFTFEAVAREANVGKPAVYRRWPTREDLLIAAIQRIEIREVLAPEMSLEEALCVLQEQYLMRWDTTPRRAYLQLEVDQIRFPHLRQLYSERVRMPLIESVRRCVTRAIERGEVAEGTSPTMLVECLYGAASMRMGSSDDVRRREISDNPRAYAAPLVSLLMRGAQPRT
jgi:AcrR family transcriptional regulator